MEILIAEDDLDFRGVLKEFLEIKGHKVFETDNGSEAWQFFKENNVKMLIVDWLMPEMDGLNLCKKIRSEKNNGYTYIIIVTAKDQKEDLIEAFDSGADDYIAKPLDIFELNSRLKTGERVLDLVQAHKDMEKILIESRNKLRTVFDSMHEKIVALDGNLRIVSINRTFLNELNATFKEIIGNPFFQVQIGINNNINNDKIKAHVLNAYRSGETQSAVVELTSRNGEQTYNAVSCIPIMDDAGEVFQIVIVSKDITEERNKSEKIRALNQKIRDSHDQIKAKNTELIHAMKQLKDSQARILETEKMASVGQLAAGVAHEINNPIGFVGSNLQTLLDYQNDIKKVLVHYRSLIQDLKTTEVRKHLPAAVSDQVEIISSLEEKVDFNFLLDDIQDLIEDCREGTERIKNIVLNLKEFAHPGENQMGTGDINKCIESTLNVVWNELKYKAEVTRNFGELPLVKCYPQQLNQVFMNILVNAAQAIENLGKIDIETRVDNGFVEIRISDTGVGIPRENLSKIFDPFFTTKEVGKGTGLGMNVAYNIVKKHNGTIEVESTVGKGTTFTTRIPIE